MVRSLPLSLKRGFGKGTGREQLHLARPVLQQQLVDPLHEQAVGGQVVGQPAGHLVGVLDEQEPGGFREPERILDRLQGLVRPLQAGRRDRIIAGGPGAGLDIDLLPAADRTCG